MHMGNFVIAVYCRNGNHRSVCLGAALHYALVATPDQVMAPPAVTNITEWAGDWARHKCGPCSRCQNAGLSQDDQRALGRSRCRILDVWEGRV